MVAKKLKNVKKEETPIRLNIGCGPTKMDGFVSVDVIKFHPEVEVWNAGVDVWPYADNSISEVIASHLIEHLIPEERCHFLNELYRVLKPDCPALIIAPHFASCRAYGDPTHQWPPIGEMFWAYLSKEWRMANAPHTDAENLDWGYTCDFTDPVIGTGLNPAIVPRDQAYQQHAMANFKEAILDLHVTLKKKA